jgi:8-oxo-dGTP diphosphatase
VAGEAQAAALAELLAVFAPTRLVSASPRRCVATLSPLAASLDLPVEVDAVFDETADPAVAARRIEALAAAEPSTVVCSQGGLIPGVLSTLGRDAGEVSARWHRPEGRYYHTPKGTGWLLPFSRADLLGAHALPATG